MSVIIVNLITVLITVFITSCMCVASAILYRFKISCCPVSDKKANKLSENISVVAFFVCCIIALFVGKFIEPVIISIFLTAAIFYFINKHILNNGYESDYYARLKDIDSLFKAFTDTLSDIAHDIDNIRSNSYNIKDEALRTEKFEKIKKISYISKRFPDVINEFYNDFGCIAEKIIEIRCDDSCFDNQYENIIFLYETSQKYLIDKYRTQIKDMGGTIDKKDYGEVDYSDFVEE